MGEMIPFDPLFNRCTKCAYHDPRLPGTCKKPGGYELDWKRMRCRDFRRRKEVTP